MGQGPRKQQRHMRNLLLQPLLQVQLALYMLILATIFSLCIFVSLYINLTGFVDMMSVLIPDESQLKGMLEVYVSQTKWWFTGFVLFFWILSGTVAIIYTHRMVGPFVAFRAHLERLMSGDYKSRVKLRKHDAFQDFAIHLNRLALHLSEHYHGPDKLP